MVSGHAVCLLHGVFPNLLNAPGFIERHPHHNTGMVVIPQDTVDPFLIEIFGVFRRVDIGGPYLAPNQQAHPIRVIVKSRVFDLLMQPNAVEPHLFNELDVLDKGFVIGRGQ